MPTPIVCPICEEFLGNSIEEIPEKCRVCDTRKNEILHELSLLEKKTALPGSPEAAPSNVGKSPAKETAASVLSNPQSQVIVEEEVSEKAVAEQSETVIEHSQPVVAKETAPQEDVIFNEQHPPVAVQGQSQDVIQSQSQDVIFEDKADASQTASSEDVIFDNAATAVSSTVTPLPVQVPTPEPVPSGPRKSGASQLETFAIGYKYCPNCGAGFAKDFPEERCCHCQAHPALQAEAKGFPPGHYLVLYNDKHKAISYFHIDRAGSVIIGRASERSSLNDIDLTLAWKHHYQQDNLSGEEFQKKMSFLQGISRKHALVRYIHNERKYVLFHLSENNFTVVKYPTGERRERSPRDRTRVDLAPDCFIMLGNQEKSILMRYKVISKLQS